MSNEFNPVPFLDDDDLYRIARAKLLNKVGLSIKDQIEFNGLTRKQACSIAKISEPRMSDLLNGRLSRFSERALFEIALRLGVRFDIDCMVSAIVHDFENR